MKNSIYSVKDNRLEFLDVAKGLGIILVVIGHVSINNIINTWIYSFHMPLFFVISGYLNSCSKKKISNKKYIIKKSKRLLVPYFIFSIISYIYWVVIERSIRGIDDVSIIKEFVNIFIAKGGSENYVFNAVMWFLPCLFITEIIFYFINKKDNSKRIAMILILSSVIGYLLSCYSHIRLPWCIDIMFTSVVFYGIGYYMSNNKSLFNNSDSNRFKYSLAIMGSFLLVVFISYFNGRVDMNNNVFNNYFMFYIGALMGINFILLLSNKVKYNWITYLGRNSLIIMLVHEPLKRIILKLIEMITKINMDTLRGNIFLIIICSCLIILLITPLIFIINKFLPIVIGKGMKKKCYK